MVTKEVILDAVHKFVNQHDELDVEPLGNGLINSTYKILDHTNSQSTVLQAINANIFKKPEDIISNYQEIYEYLNAHSPSVRIPAPLASSEGGYLWVDAHKNYWRANAFVENSYSPMNALTEEAAFTVAKSFAEFTRSLQGLDISRLKEIIPDFHNLSFRFQQFEEAIAKGPINRLLKSTHIIAQLRQRKKLVAFYDSIQHSDAYPSRVMHHDCKISNILFNKLTNEVICPVDMDTTMPGKFFSDIGDMIRTMTCSVDENSTEWEFIKVRPSFYEAIMEGYLLGAGEIFTSEEKKNMHYSGLILTYMQSIRFVTDFINGDIYYRINYPEQNLNRALNQLILLERLEEYLKNAHSFIP